jgi:hypothetical protein
LAFHPYPQLIPSVFNLSGFGPPRRLTVASTWPWVDHSASGLEHATTPHKVDTPYSGLAFATATPHGLTSRHATNSQAHSSKGTPSPATVNCSPALTDCKRTVSGTISLPSRGTFHLSLTVLVRYRSPGSIQAYRVVPTDSQQISRARCYLGIHNDSCNVFVYGTLTLYDRPFQTTSTNTTISHCRPIRQNRQCKPHNPPYATPAGYHTHKVWPHPLSLATTHGITIVFSSCGY